jgi:hypothetical protein
MSTSAAACEPDPSAIDQWVVMRVQALLAHDTVEELQSRQTQTDARARARRLRHELESDTMLADQASVAVVQVVSNEPPHGAGLGPPPGVPFAQPSNLLRLADEWR